MISSRIRLGTGCAARCWIRDKLPARIEGVVEERLARLAGELRETLAIGSVMGVDFTAQVVGRVQQIQERTLLKNLAHELDRRHHLVQEKGETKVGQQSLSWYRFTHALVQQFVYGDLSAGERRLLHGDVADVLEELYAGHTDEIAVQLARHFEQVGLIAKAVGALVLAGRQAYRVVGQSRGALAYHERADIAQSAAGNA